MKKILLLLLVVLIVLFVFPKKSSYSHKQLFYDTYGGSGLSNYGRECTCFGLEVDTSNNYEFQRHCVGIPICRGLY